MTAIAFQAGDILSASTEVLVSTANPAFQLTGGIGALLMRTGGAAFQQELNALSRAAFGTRPAPRGSLLVSSSANLAFRAIVHVVSIDVFYRTEPQVLEDCTAATVAQVVALGARTVALPAFATGYGRHPLASCASAMRRGLTTALARHPLERVELWLRDDHRLSEFRAGWGS